MKVQTKKEIKLIDGVFTPNEAKSILVTMIDNKINYHKLDDFSFHIRTNRHPHHSKQRVEELLETKAQLRSWIDLIQEHSTELKIKGTVIIEVDEDIQ
nr:hypothetical protein [uncultured Flavobacterium sp.]